MKKTYTLTKKQISDIFEAGVNAEFETFHLKTYEEREELRQSKLKKILDKYQK